MLTKMLTTAQVVPRTGYVDRNIVAVNNMYFGAVVPRTGYVDRNDEPGGNWADKDESYPARGTWIEMQDRFGVDVDYKVVPRTGYVDRNIVGKTNRSFPRVVPRTGYVDRNTTPRSKRSRRRCRTPHGVRG